MDEWQEWFERVWEFREETLYPELFGGASKGGIYTLTFDLFKNRFGVTSVDPRWLNHGVLVFQPTLESPSWRFVTSGLSNAWEADAPDPNEWSGVGVEFLLQTPTEDDWALSVTLNILAYQLLLAAGHFEGNPPLLGEYHRIPLGGPIDGVDSLLTHLLVCRSPTASRDLQLESGRFTLLQLVGVTGTEIDFARSHSGEELVRLLEAASSYPVIDPTRASVI